MWVNHNISYIYVCVYPLFIIYTLPVLKTELRRVHLLQVDHCTVFYVWCLEPNTASYESWQSDLGKVTLTYWRLLSSAV